MSLVLILSIVVLVIAMAWSIVLLCRLRDWRMSFFTGMLSLMVLSQILMLREKLAVGTQIEARPESGHQAHP